jgi:hypothetical protein
MEKYKCRLILVSYILLLSSCNKQEIDLTNDYLSLALGGHFVISGSMSLGNFAAFNSYLTLLIFPIIVIGFIREICGECMHNVRKLDIACIDGQIIDY